MSEADTRAQRAAFAMLMFPERFGLKDDWWLLGPTEDPRRDPDTEVARIVAQLMKTETP